MTIANRNLLPGLLLILLGVVFLLPTFSDLRAREIWPLLLIAFGALFLVLWLRERTATGYLMPAAILVTIGLMFFATQMRWSQMQHLWPFFIMAPGFGFLAMYFLGKKEKGLLTPAVILLVIGSVFLLGAGTWQLFWPFLLIAIGVLLLIRARR